MSPTTKTAGEDLVGLLAPDRDDRLSAVAAARGSSAVFALREVLLFDEDAEVRAAACERMRALGPEGAAALARLSALHDALFDTHPSVRLGACRGLGRLASGDDEAAHDVQRALARVVLEEPVWWVRRAACFALARAAGRGAIATLTQALDDPFWRVRHAAVRALLALGERGEPVTAAIAEATSDRAQAAAGYLLRRLGEAVLPLQGAHDGRTDALRGAADDPDPAVVAARLAAGHRATLAELVEYLGDSHATLRAAAVERLRRARHLPALLAACAWLDEPRIPYAAQTVLALFDALEDPEPLVLAILADVEARPGASLWALGHPCARGRLEDIEHALKGSALPARRGAAAALGALPAVKPLVASGEAAASGRIEAVLVAALVDPDADVRRIAAHGLVRAGTERGLRAVLTAPSDGPLWDRLAALAAAALDDRPALVRAARSRDARTASTALAALFTCDVLTADETSAARAHVDPWIRRAVLDETHALEVAVSDVDPTLRRAAFVLARRSDGLIAARALVESPDPWLRAAAASRLARAALDEAAELASRRADLARVMGLAVDPDPAVRAAAADVAFLTPDAPLRLARLEAGDAMAIGDHARPAQRNEAPRRPITMSLVTTVGAAEQAQRVPRTIAIASPRPLGRSGFAIAPLAVSGVNEPSIASLHRAADSGANLFFWEPRHRALRTFLRDAGSEARVVCGSYHAGAADITRDIERSLRALRRDRLDLFLLFWVRSPARLGPEERRALERAKAAGLVGAIGFSCHDRALVERAIREPERPWDVVMVRHSAAHPGAEDTLLPAAVEHGVGVLGFSETSYGRLLEPGTDGWAPSAADCYRYGLSQPGVSAVVAAPRGGAELIENLGVLDNPRLDAAALSRMRAHGREVRARSLDFASHIRRFPAVPEELGEAILEQELAHSFAPSFGDG